MLRWAVAAGCAAVLVTAILLARAPERNTARPATPRDPGIAKPATSLPSDAALRRKSSRTSPGGAGSLTRRLADSALPFDERARAALLLGSCDDEESWRALLRELSSASDPAWIRVLLLAIGGNREHPDVDDRFGPADGPWYVGIAGLHFQIRHVLDRDDARAAVQQFLGHADPDVRRAAVTVLIHSTEHPDVRRSLASCMETEAEEDSRANAAKAVAEWTSRRPLQDPERTELLGRLVRQSAPPQRAELRLRIQPHVAETPMTDEEVQGFLSMAAHGETELRRWGLEIATRAASRTGIESSREVAAVATTLSATDGDAKVRETAVRCLGMLENGEEVRTALHAALGDPAWHVRVQAIRALRGLPPTVETQEALIRMTSDPDENVRAAATEASGSR